VRDGHTAFIGSQSLRELELDERREAGIIFRDPKVVSLVVRTFEEDWLAAEQSSSQMAENTEAPAVKVARKVAKALTKSLPSVGPVLDGAFRELIGAAANAELNTQEVEAMVRGAVKAAVKEVVRDVVEEVVEQHSGEAR
jgi:cardiolipin synthase